jgi:anti-sigma B factor antagonist
MEGRIVPNFKITPDGHGFIVSGELDLANAREFAAAFREALPVGGPCTVDMRPLTFLDSSGIQTIVAAAKLAPNACIVLHGVHDEVQKVVEMTGVAAMPNLHVIHCTVGVQPDPA